MAYVNNVDTLVDQATIDIAVAGPYNAVKIALYTNNVYPQRGMTVEEYDFADFAGLTNKKTVTWGTPFVNAAQQAEVWGALTTWLALTDPEDPVTAYGWVILNTAATAWIVAERFADAVIFNAAGNTFGMVPRLVWDT